MSRRRLYAMATVLVCCVLFSHGEVRSGEGKEEPKWIAVLYDKERQAVALRWTSNSRTAEYTVERHASNEDQFVEIASTAAEQLFFDHGVRPGESYVYRVVAHEGNVRGRYSDERRIRVPGQIKDPPSPPIWKDIEVRAGSDWDKVWCKVDLSWESSISEHQSRVAAYRIFRRSGPSADYVPRASVGEPRYVDDVFATNQAFLHSYVLRAYDVDARESVLSKEIQAVCLMYLQPRIGFRPAAALSSAASRALNSGNRDLRGMAEKAVGLREGSISEDVIRDAISSKEKDIGWLALLATDKVEDSGRAGTLLYSAAISRTGLYQEAAIHFLAARDPQMAEELLLDAIESGGENLAYFSYEHFVRKTGSQFAADRLYEIAVDRRLDRERRGMAARVLLCGDGAPYKKMSRVLIDIVGKQTADQDTIDIIAQEIESQNRMHCRLTKGWR